MSVFSTLEFKYLQTKWKFLPDTILSNSTRTVFTSTTVNSGYKIGWLLHNMATGTFSVTILLLFSYSLLSTVRGSNKLTDTCFENCMKLLREASEVSSCMVYVLLTDFRKKIFDYILFTNVSGKDINQNYL